MTNTHYDAVVLGAGAAGLSAAQALGRSLRRTLVIDAGAPRNRFASHMHNVLGLDGTPPLELVARGRAEAEVYGVEFTEGTVSAVTGHGDVTLELAPDQQGTVRRIETRALIVATGASDTLPDVPGLADYWGSTVLHCPYCHGWEVRGSRLAVLAASPLALHQATLIRQWSEHLTVFSAALGELAPDIARALQVRGTVIEPSPVTEVLGDGARVTGIRTANGADHEIDAIFTMGAVTPHDGFLAGLNLARTETPVGDFLTVDPGGRTSHPRIWAAGNVVNPMATVPIAMGAGAQAGGSANYALVELDVAAALAADAVRSGGAA